MNFREFTQKRIKELEAQISSHQMQKELLQKEMENLINTKFDENIENQSDNPTLLKG